MLAGAYPIGVLIGGIPGGIATARFGARPVAITGALVTGAATFVFATADSIWVLDAARFVQGLGSACTWAAGLTWLVSETPSARRGQTIGTALAFAIVGALCSARCSEAWPRSSARASLSVRPRCSLSRSPSGRTGRRRPRP